MITSSPDLNLTNAQIGTAGRDDCRWLPALDLHLLMPQFRTTGKVNCRWLQVPDLNLCSE